MYVLHRQTSKSRNSVIPVPLYFLEYESLFLELDDPIWSMESCPPKTARQYSSRLPKLEKQETARAMNETQTRAWSRKATHSSTFVLTLVSCSYLMPWESSCLQLPEINNQFGLPSMLIHKLNIYWEPAAYQALLSLWGYLAGKGRHNLYSHKLYIPLEKPGFNMYLFPGMVELAS